MTQRTTTVPTTGSSEPMDGPGAPRTGTAVPVWQTTALAVAAAVLTWVVLVPVAGVGLTTRAADGTHTDVVDLVSIVVSAVVVSLAGTLTAWLIGRRTARPRRAWLLTGMMVFVLSLIGPVGSGATTAAILGLALFHVVVTAAVVPLLAAALPSRRGDR